MAEISSILTNTNQQLNDFRIKQAREDLQAQNKSAVEESEFAKKLASGFQVEKDVPQTGSTNLGKDDFLRILVTQLQNQDPSQPMDDKEFIAQMAQFSSLEQITNMSRGFEQMTQSVEKSFALSLIGKQVQVLPKNADSITGVVSEVTTGKESKVKINDVMYDVKDIVKISTLEVQ